MRFLDVNNLTDEDLENIKHIGIVEGVDWGTAMELFAERNPGKIKVLGEMKDGEVERNEISEEGVKEYKGAEALSRIIKEAIKNKEEDK